MLTKPDVLSAIRSSLAAELETLAHATRLARDEATGEESRPENEYDTRALEASYLAAGQGARLETLRGLASWFAQQTGKTPMERVGVGALVQLERDDGGRRWFFMAPTGGVHAKVDGTEVAVISPESVLGREIIDLEEDDGAEVHGPKGVFEWVVVSVA